MHRGVDRYLPTRTASCLARYSKYLLVYLLFGDVETDPMRAC